MNSQTRVTPAAAPRRRTSRLPRSVMAFGSAVALVAVASSPGAAADQVVAGDFTSPLGFAVGSDGTLYVAEAFLGQLTAVPKKGERKVVVAAADGQFTSGVDAKGKGTLSYTLSLPPEFQDGPPADTTLNRVLPNGKTLRSTSLLAYEQSVNPDSINTYGLVGVSAQCLAEFNAASEIFGFGPAVFTGVVDSDPYAVAIDTDGSRVVAEAAGNDVIRVSANGTRVSTVAVLPPITQTITAESVAGLGVDACIGQPNQSDPVPTDVEIGPDGNYYVSALPGFPESPGAGKVFKINRSNGAVTEVAGGFSGAVDLAVAADGSIYVAELYAGKVSKVNPGGDSASSSVSVTCPTAVEIGPDGTVLAAEGGQELDPSCQDGPVQGRIIRLAT